MKPVPITYVLIMAVGKKEISFAQGLKILDGIIREGYRLSAEDYIAIKAEMEKIGRR